MKTKKSFKRFLWWAFTGGMIYFLFCLPSQLFNDPTSSVIYSRNSELLSGVIAADGQWRFPDSDSIPVKFRAALLEFEDRHFEDHNGIYLPSVIRAVKQNVMSEEVVSGASTLTMQVIRLSRKNPPRTVSEKLREMMLALRLELTYSKDEIISFYASHAPFGGNVVGIEAASWRYFGRSPHDLSWSEAATLAVLPNAPSLIYPGKNQEKLLVKRNRLLTRLFESGKMDKETFELSCAEPLPGKPFPLPQVANHLLQTTAAEHGWGKRFYSSIDKGLQENVIGVVSRHISVLSANKVYNAAVLVIDNSTGEIIAYVGNSQDAKNNHGNMVDIIPAPRSTGSILKPILYAAMLDDGLMLPNTLLADVPIEFDGFSPRNFTETFDGAVPASRALSRSLNVPAVLMLRDYGYPRFYHLLKKMGFHHMDQPADHYGLSLILGGADASLLEITTAYAAMSRKLAGRDSVVGSRQSAVGSRQSAVGSRQSANGSRQSDCPLGPGAIWSTYKALLEVNRPESESGWELYQSSSHVAWKTGTSFGNRDAWAIGTTPDYVVGVWVGNADGQGRPELTGVECAAPMLFDVLELLETNSWFSAPYDDLEEVEICHESGMRAGMYCNHRDTVMVPKSGLRTSPCHFHQRIFIDEQSGLRVNADCAPGSLIPSSWFILPPSQEYFYRRKHPEYRELPDYLAGCSPSDESPIALIRPHGNADIFIPRNISGKKEKLALEATHRDDHATLYWHIDGIFIGETLTIHEMEIDPGAGERLLTLVDQNGETFTKKLRFISR